MDSLLQILHDTNNITADVADKAKVQLGRLCCRVEHELHTRLTEFVSSKSRLDSFYFDLLGKDQCYSELWTVIRLILTLSHGNATVESGFSINKAVLVENMLEESVIAQRVVYDAIHAAGSVLQVNINKSLQQYVRTSRSAYEDALRKKREAAAVEDTRSKEKKRAADQMKQLKAKKARVQTAAVAEAIAIESEIAELEKVTKQ
jgi:hypothetical protein